MAILRYNNNNSNENKNSTRKEDMWNDAIKYAKTEKKTAENLLKALGVQYEENILVMELTKVKYKMIAEARLNRDRSFDDLEMPEDI